MLIHTVLLRLPICPVWLHSSSRERGREGEICLWVPSAILPSKISCFITQRFHTKQAGWVRNREKIAFWIIRFLIFSFFLLKGFLKVIVEDNAASAPLQMTIIFPICLRLGHMETVHRKHTGSARQRWRMEGGCIPLLFWAHPALIAMTLVEREARATNKQKTDLCY